MSISDKHIHTLELDKVLELLCKEASFSDAAEQAKAIRPATGLYEAKLLLQETEDAHMLIGRFGAPAFGGFCNVSNSLRRARSGGVLSMGELLAIAGVLRGLRTLSEWRRHCLEVATCIDYLFDALNPNKYLEDKIQFAIVSEEEMADNASPELAALRRKIRAASSKVRDQLEKMIRSVTMQKYLQDPIITIRNGRFVVPVKAECRGEIPGLVHDTSASGATVFVEPMGVVEANNDIRVLHSKEAAEMERILAELSSEAGGFAESITASYEATTALGVIFAKAKLAYRMKAMPVELNDQGRILLKKARHPLIDANKVVPTDIELGRSFDTLIITGPNTGGKTVALKTLGLFTLMAMCGLMLPVADQSTVSVFDQVLADIGDEQSIEQSLSTFSSHMTNIVAIQKQADAKSLVLLDELGAGTDPVEGAALAIAILEDLRHKGAKLAATTHYAELKSFALDTAGVENASCEFDVGTLRPTYRLLIGVPGRSNAFAISQRLGMEETVIQRANALLSEESKRFEAVVQTLEENRQSVEREKQEVERLHAEMEGLKEQAEQKLAEARKQADLEVERSRVEARNLVSSARAQMQALLDELDDLKRSNKALDASAKARLKAGLRNLENTADPVQSRPMGAYVLPRPLKAGDRVRIFDLDKEATVLQLPDENGNVLVQAGIIKTRVPLSNLRLLQPKQAGNPLRGAGARVSRPSAPQTVRTELDLRGKTAMEAILELDQFIDAAVLSGIHQLTIIHGKGTGVLRREVQNHLKSHRSIKSFRLGNYGEGEAGVTIAELK